MMMIMSSRHDEFSRTIIFCVCSLSLSITMGRHYVKIGKKNVGGVESENITPRHSSAGSQFMASSAPAHVQRHVAPWWWHTTDTDDKRGHQGDHSGSHGCCVVTRKFGNANQHCAEAERQDQKLHVQALIPRNDRHHYSMHEHANPHSSWIKDKKAHCFIFVSCYVGSRRRHQAGRGGSFGEHLVPVGRSRLDLHGRMERRSIPLQDLQILSSTPFSTSSSVISRGAVSFFLFLHLVNNESEMGRHYIIFFNKIKEDERRPNMPIKRKKKKWAPLIALILEFYFLREKGADIFIFSSRSLVSIYRRVPW